MLDGQISAGWRRTRSRGRAPLVAAIMLLVAMAPGCEQTRTSEEDSSLTLFVAASLGDVIERVGAEYERTHDVELVYNFGGSGALAQQLLASPRADLFVSASQRWMDVLQERGRLVGSSRRTLLSNELVVIANRRSDLRLDSPADLCAADFEHLSIGDPEFVPGGGYAREWLRSVPCPDGGSLWSLMRDRIAPAPDVRAALTQVAGNIDVVGIVYRTDYAARPDAVRLLYEVPVEGGPDIEYPAAVIATSTAPELARDLLDTLQGPAARAVFEEHGFSAPPGS